MQQQVFHRLNVLCEKAHRFPPVSWINLRWANFA
jgi:hypothetical protein